MISNSSSQCVGIPFDRWNCGTATTWQSVAWWFSGLVVRWFGGLVVASVSRAQWLSWTLGKLVSWQVGKLVSRQGTNIFMTPGPQHMRN